MRSLVALLIAFFLLGCIQPEKPQANVSANASANITPNVTTNFTPSIPAANITQPAANASPANATQENVSVPPVVNVSLPANVTPANVSPANASNASVQELSAVGFGDYVLLIEDLTVPTGASRISCASMGVFTLEGARLATLQGCPGESIYWTAPDGHRWRIVVYQTAPGYSGNAWAEVAVFG